MGGRRGDKHTCCISLLSWEKQAALCCLSKAEVSAGPGLVGPDGSVQNRLFGARSCASLGNGDAEGPKGTQV